MWNSSGSLVHLVPSVPARSSALVASGHVVEEVAEVNPGALHFCGDVTLLQRRPKGHVVCAT
jgi:hypothetical protein